MNRHYTGLPIAVDCTCLRCTDTQVLHVIVNDARLVNVLPGPKPEDDILVVTNEAMDQIPERLRPYIDRKTTKRIR